MSDPNRVIPCDITESIEEIAAFWTEERMKKAKPVSPRVRRKAGARRGLEMRPQQAVDPTLNAVSNLTIPPYSAVGKLFFMDVYGGEGVGTAWIVGESIIATAGQCIGEYDEEEMMPLWSHHMMFCPQYSGGQSPLGRYSMKTYFGLEGWLETPDIGEEVWNYDLAMCLTRDPMPLDKTGILSFEPNVFTAVNTLVLALGYPGDTESYQDSLYESNGQFLLNTDSESEELASNALPEGANGGPWLVKLESGLSTVLGLNTFKEEEFTDWPSWLSPYFGQGMVNLLNAAQDE